MIAVYLADTFYRLDLLERIELKTLDYRFLWRGAEKPDDRIVILGIDDKALDKIKDPMVFWGPHFAKVIRKLAQAGARSIGMDFVFSIPITKSVDGEDYDKILAMALREANCVVMAKTFRNDRETNAYLVDEAISRLRFAASPEYAGFVNLTNDPDNCVRRQTLVVQDINSKGHLAFGLAIVAKYYDILGKKKVSVKGSNVIMGDKVVPINRYGEMLINFAGPSGNFHHISFYEAWKMADEDGSIGYFRENFTNKIVLIGTTNILHQDFKPTPFFASNHYKELRSTYGIEIWANVINTMLQDKYITRVPGWQVSIIILFIGLFVSYVSLRLSLIKSLLALIAFGVAYIFLCIEMFIGFNIWVSMAAPFVTIPLTCAVIFTYRFTIENRQRSVIKSLFQHYLHPDVVNELLKDPDNVKLGGVKKELTVFFSDIQDFTSISEKMEPEELVKLMNVYLTNISDIIIKYEGTIDKYVGDAVMAFFGAPLDQKDHALRACYAAIETQEHMQILRKSFKVKGWPEISSRIGINTGMVVVGNMGGENRFNYTVIGDDVNLASRLEGVNKIYSTNIMIGENTYTRVKDSIVARELDVIRVKGKSRPVKVYELIDRKGETDDETLEFLKNFAAGLEAYRKQDWNKATEGFISAINIKHEDYPSQLYLSRCNEFKTIPPLAEWDGVYEMKSK